MNIAQTELILTRRKVLQRKKILKKIYEEWYGKIAEQLPDSQYPILEIGSGAGFFKNFVKHKKIISSEILKTSCVDLVCDACNGIPLKNESLSAIVMTDVLHHLPNVTVFFSEANRLLINGGKIIMIEPWVTKWSKFIYKYIHHEPFNLKVDNWNFDSKDPLFDANSALPYIIFNRDIALFKTRYPEFYIHKPEPIMPFIYLLSGGFSFRSILPSSCYSFIRKFEMFFEKYILYFPMFAFIKIEKCLK